MTDWKVVQKWLVQCGWPLHPDGVRGPSTNEALKDFKEMTGLPLNSVYDIPTEKLLAHLADMGGRFSANYHFAEFADTMRHWPKATRPLIVGLEKHATKHGQKLFIVGPWRTKERNAAVGGATNSRHLEVYHDAVDISPHPLLSVMMKDNFFRRYEYDSRQRGAARTVWHVDMSPNSSGAFPYPHPTR